MYDTRPDLQSYLLAARRLWWIPLLCVVLSVVTVRPSSAESKQVATAVAQVPDPQGLSSVGRMGLLYDARSEAASLAGDLALTGTDPDGTETATVEARPAQPTVDIEFSAADADGVDGRLDQINDLLAQRWVAQMDATLAPLRVWAETSLAATTQKLELGGATADDVATVERVRLIEQQIDDRALIEALDAVASNPPVATLVTSSSSATGGGLLVPVGIRVGIGLFLGLGVVIIVGLTDGRARRRSVVERNGLSVVAVATPDDSLDAVPAALVAASGGPFAHTVVAGVSSADHLRAVTAALGADPSVESVVELERPYVGADDFVHAVRDADAVVLVIDAGRTKYADAFEAARTAVGSGATNVCAVMVVKGSRALAEARS